MRGENRKWQIGLLMAGMALALYGCTKETRASETEAEASPVEIAAESGQQDENDAQIQTLPVIYSFDNSSRVQESQSGVFTGDWDRDGTDDTLTIQTEEQEGSEMIQRLELTLSGCAEAYVMEEADCDFIDILSGDYDGDQETEILLLFDMRYAGANGCCGLQLLDQTGSAYQNVTEDFFTGVDYAAEVQSGENSGYCIVNKQSGEEFFIEKETVSESALAEVTGWYALEILEGEKQDYIRLKQYVAGEDMLDHAGDIITVLSFGDNGWRTENVEIEPF